MPKIAETSIINRKSMNQVIFIFFYLLIIKRKEKIKNINNENLI